MTEQQSLNVKSQNILRYNHMGDPPTIPGGLHPPGVAPRNIKHHHSLSFIMHFGPSIIAIVVHCRSSLLSPPSAVHRIK
eukprot:scaffold746_cov293-Chaetoceros_neogracile.AAC.25